MNNFLIIANQRLKVTENNIPGKNPWKETNNGDFVFVTKLKFIDDW
jgi:hypothetical protein